MGDKPRLLVVGAREGSLGEAVALAAVEEWEYEVVATAGISGENHKLDITNTQTIKDVLNEVQPHSVVCTVGVNIPTPTWSGPGSVALSYEDHFRTNVIGVIELLRVFGALSSGYDGPRKKFVAISSNSAHIARTESGPYCASKAALSMALRVAAREMGTKGWGPVIWGYEPGLLAGTPMTQQVTEVFAGPVHRMKGVPPEGLGVQGLATRILCDLAFTSAGHNGVMFPYDAGEQ